MPTAENLYERYKGYHKGGENCSLGDDQWFLNSTGSEKLFEFIMRVAAKHVRHGTFLDVGCSYGRLLRIAVERGYDAFGVEPCLEPFQHCSELFGDRVYREEVQHCGFMDDKFDIVTMVNVLEHVPNVGNTLTEIKRILKPGGALIIVIPNLLVGMPAIAWARRVKNYELTSSLALFDAPFHLCYFTPGTLERLLQSVGFRIVLKTNAPVIRNRSRIKTLLKSTYKSFSNVFAFLTQNRLLIGHSILFVVVKPS